MFSLIVFKQGGISRFHKGIGTTPQIQTVNNIALLTNNDSTICFLSSTILEVGNSSVKCDEKNAYLRKIWESCSWIILGGEIGFLKCAKKGAWQWGGKEKLITIGLNYLWFWNDYFDSKIYKVLIFNFSVVYYINIFLLI